MGLRLYQPPVESDIQSKPGADRTARSRSTIRRALDRHEDRVRERRRRVLAAAAGYSSYDTGRASLAEPPSIPPATTDSNGSTSGSEQGRRTRRDAASGLDVLDDGLRDVASRMGVLDDRVVAMFGERWAHLHSGSNPSALRDDDNPSPVLTMAVDPDFLPRRRSRFPPHRVMARAAVSMVRSTQDPNNPSRSATRSPPGGSSRAPMPGNSMRDGLISFLDDPIEGTRPRQAASNRRPLATEATRLDGLGDRNRSLSPEGDNQWHTLVSTLTPDPQPPSVGSSFASASASAVASQSTGGPSSRTSLATRDTTEDSTFEPACESGCDNSDTEGDDDDEVDPISVPTLSSLTAPRAGQRFYVDAARSNSEDPLELLGGIGGMQRIVRNLARREDIPDEWWAEVGLSRTLSREASRS